MKLCSCSSTLFHGQLCELVHPELAALPKVMPKDVSIEAVRLRVAIKGRTSVTPSEARAVARQLLLAADEAERSYDRG